jgi:nicotinamidase-related amidase
MIRKQPEAFNKLHISLDEHHRNDGSHNVCWKDRHGNVTSPFTIITHQHVVDMEFVPTFAMGVWEGRPVAAREWALKYTAALEKRGRAPLCLWPVHCQIGTWGANVYHPLREAYDEWCEHVRGWLDPISKGTWPWTEHYSALQADVPDPTRRETQMNTAVVNDSAGADKIVWCGWAGSHCEAWTAKDGVNFFEPTDDEKKAGAKNQFIEKCIFLEDACAPIPNPPGGPDFAKERQCFLDEMAKRGAAISTTTEVFRLL